MPLLAAALASPALAAESAGARPPFPPPLSAYQGEQGLSLSAVLASRVRAEPLNGVASGLFLLAILHTFAAPRITALANRLQREAEAAAAASPREDEDPPDPHSFK